MSVHRPHNTLAPATNNKQHPLTLLAPATINEQHPLIHVAPATKNVDYYPLSMPASIESAIIKPVWFDFSTNHMRASLSMLNVKELHAAVVSETVHLHQVHKMTKEFLINTILTQFATLRAQYASLDTDKTELSAFLFFSNSLTETVTRHLMIPPCVFFDISNPLENELIIPAGASEYYNKKTLINVLKKLHPSRQLPKAPSSYSFRDLSDYMIRSICERIRNLSHPSVDILTYIRCFNPHYIADNCQTEKDLIILFLQQEYGADLLLKLLGDINQRKNKQRQQRQVKHLVDTFQANRDFWTSIEVNWPIAPALQTNLRCMQNYFHGSQWSYSAVCAVCSRKKNSSDFVTTTVNPNSKESKVTLENFEILRCHDSRIQAEFEFISNPDLNGLMLDQQGINLDRSINVCDGCLSKLQQMELPKFALKNELYRGRVPKEFSDLTWIEEMVCCVYRTTAHVIRLFNSNSDKQPKVFHGNVCAHEMNIVSTATELPRTPQDINGCISVVFIGP
jgi:hypothetical protein